MSPEIPKSEWLRGRYLEHVIVEDMLTLEISSTSSRQTENYSNRLKRQYLPGVRVIFDYLERTEDETK